MLLIPAGSIIHLNAILDGLPGYTMAALVLPVGVIVKLDARRRAFL